MLERPRNRYLDRPGRRGTMSITSGVEASLWMAMNGAIPNLPSNWSE
jgi:hypothetical protein